MRGLPFFVTVATMSFATVVIAFTTPFGWTPQSTSIVFSPALVGMNSKNASPKPTLYIRMRNLRAALVGGIEPPQVEPFGDGALGVSAPRHTTKSVFDARDKALERVQLGASLRRERLGDD